MCVCVCGGGVDMLGQLSDKVFGADLYDDLGDRLEAKLHGQVFHL